MDWAQILVIILSIFLALFLLLGIVLVALLIRLTQQIKSVTSSAQKTALDIEKIVGSFGKVSSVSTLLGLALKQAKKVKVKRKK